MKSLFWSPILSVNKWLIVPLLLFGFNSNAQDRKVKYIYSLDEKKPLAYLRVLSENAEKALFTDINGKFEFSEKQISKTGNLNISGYGINDTLISIQNVLPLDTIFLKTKEFDLPEVVINSSQLSELKIGDSSQKEFDVVKPIGLHNGPEGVFYRYAVRVKIPKKRPLYLDEIKFYVSNILREKVDISLRVLYSTSIKRIVPGKMNSISEFSELLQDNKIMTVAVSGWQKVNFSESVQVPKGVTDIFIVFDLLEEEPRSKFAIADQKASKDIDIGFYYKKGDIGIFNTNSFHPAIEVTFLK